MCRQLIPLFLLLPLLSCGQPQPMTSTSWYRLGDDSISVSITRYAGKTSPVYLNLHDNETTSVEAALPLIRKRGGSFIRINNNGERIIGFTLDSLEYCFDPNRIFSREGIINTLVRHKRISNKAIEEIEGFARFYLSLLPAQPGFVMALHNNTEGQLSINSYIDDGEDVEDAELTSKHRGIDPDDFMLTTDRRVFERFRRRFNIILQHNRRVRQDGSLSVYFGEKGIPYLNCETQHGHKKETEQMLREVHRFLDEAGL